MTKINIAFIISNLGQGGAEKQFIHLINNLDISKFEINVFLYACQKKTFYKDLDTNRNIKYKTAKLSSKNKALKIAEALISIRNFLISEKFDIVVTTLFMNNFLVRLAAPRFYNNRFVANVRTSLDHYSIKHIIAEKFQIKNSFLVFNSKKTYSQFIKIINRKFHKRLSYIYNGFELPYDPISKYPISLVFGSLGRLSKEKNILQVVRVFHKFKKRNPNAKYIIQGSFGNQYNEIKKILISESVEIREMNPEIEDFYNSINVLILSSLFEGCPNVLFEALLRKKICIISTAANSDNFITNGFNGFVYDGTDNGLLKVMNLAKKVYNTSRAEDIKKQGYLYAASNFSLSSMVKQYEQLFVKIYEENKNSY